MDLATLSIIARQFWVVWLGLLFLGIILYVFWPRRRVIYDRASRIPFDDGGRG